LQSGADILKGHDINGDFLSEGGQLKQLDSYFEKSKLLAQKLESIQCAMKGQEVKSANNMLSTLQGNALDAQGGNQSLFVCIDYSNNKMLGDPHTTNAEIDQDELDEWYKAKHDEFTNEFTQEVESLASRRVAVEVSLSDAIKDIRGTSIWAKIRQDGYLGLASYMYLINKETANNIDHFKVMTNNLSIQSVNIQDNMISNDVALQGLDDDSLKSKFPTYEHSNYSLYYDDDRFKGVDPLVSSYEWMKARLTQKREYVLNTGKTGDLEQTIEDILNIDKQFNTLGIGNYNNKINKAKCMTDSKFCPFPTGDPFIELTNVGHAMVTTSTSFFSFYFAIKGIKGAIKIAGDKTAWSGKLMGFMKNSNTQSGSVTNSSAMGKVKDVIGTVGLEAVDFVNASEKILDLIIAALGFIMVLVLVVGGFLAYGMPLVPYLFLHLNFLAWVMIVFMASFSVFLWSMYWVRLGKNKQILQRTAIHYGGQILLKPMFSLIALLFTWYFFYAANYIISATIGEFLSGVHVTGTFTSLYHVIIKWFVIFSVYALIIKLIISSVDQMTSDLFSKLGIEETTSKDRINDVIKLVLFEKGSSLAQKSLQKMSNQQTQNQKQYEKAMKIMREAGDKGND
ncbi:MAG: hypothetical protein HAW67_02500, partial [Endozoicomonadaceae bacterium]|nr:hypothetical protein [Endozoicomonadaceae bacterium]